MIDNCNYLPKNKKIIKLATILNILSITKRVLILTKNVTRKANQTIII